jgi:hypothetical protein
LKVVGVFVLFVRRSTTIHRWMSKAARSQEYPASATGAVAGAAAGQAPADPDLC